MLVLLYFTREKRRLAELKQPFIGEFRSNEHQNETVEFVLHISCLLWDAESSNSIKVMLILLSAFIGCFLHCMRRKLWLGPKLCSQCLQETKYLFGTP